MQLDALLQGRDFIAVACSLCFQRPTLGGKIVATHIEQGSLAFHHMPGQRDHVLVGCRLLRHGIGEIRALQLSLKPRAADGLRRYLHLQIGIFLLRGNKLHSSGNGRCFALSRATTQSHQFKRHHAGAKFVLAGGFDVPHHKHRRILIDRRGDSQTRNMLGKGGGNLLTDLQRGQPLHGDVSKPPDNRYSHPHRPG
ncbi:Uncharacterised protein [Brucella melitensis]|nr:Uncharacterised protein [Brucella melitensis]